MPEGELRLTPWQEHHFWLHVLRDHAEFVLDYLSPREEKWVERAVSYRQAFQELLQRLETLGQTLPESSPEMIELARAAYSVAYGYYQFEGQLQNLRLHNDVVLFLTPTYFNGTLSENQEYLRLLAYFMRGDEPVQLSLPALLDVWLEDQLGHSLLLRAAIDPVEAAIQTQIADYTTQFQAHMLKHHHIKRYLRFAPPGFPLQRQFVRDLVQSIVGFRNLVIQVMARYEADAVSNRTTYRLMEHHFPETEYFLLKLAAFAPEVMPLIKSR